MPVADYGLEKSWWYRSRSCERSSSIETGLFAEIIR
jgi:hypothetical protein